MKIYSQLTILALLTLTLGCGAEETEKEDPPSKNFVEQTFELNRVVKRNGDVDVVTPGDVTLTFDDMDIISGRILCNSYAAKLEWNKNEATIVQLELTNRDCGRSAPFVWSKQTEFVFGTDLLDIKFPNTGVRAIFKLRDGNFN